MSKKPLGQTSLETGVNDPCDLKLPSSHLSSFFPSLVFSRVFGTPCICYECEPLPPSHFPIFPLAFPAADTCCCLLPRLCFFQPWLEFLRRVCSCSQLEGIQPIIAGETRRQEMRQLGNCIIHSQVAERER